MKEFIVKYDIYLGIPAVIPKDGLRGGGGGGGLNIQKSVSVVNAKTAAEAVNKAVKENFYKIKITDIVVV